MIQHNANWTMLGCRDGMLTNNDINVNESVSSKFYRRKELFSVRNLITMRLSGTNGAQKRTQYSVCSIGIKTTLKRETVSPTHSSNLFE